MNTKVVLIRSDSLGLDGTIANAKHHAEAILPYIDALKPIVPRLGFKLWKQGHNVHEFVTIDGRRFTLRAFIDNENTAYIGIRFSLRLDRSNEVRLIDITSIGELAELILVMKKVAEPSKGKLGRLLSEAGQEQTA